MTILKRRLQRASRASQPRTSELEALRQSLSLCQDSIRHLTALLAASGNGAPAVGSPKISVIMPVYNRANIVAVAIKSVLAQEGAHFELIVVDDGSSDGLHARQVPELAAACVTLLSMEHEGVCAARNRGVAASSGDVIVYLDSDNRMYPGYLKAIASAYAARPDAGCGYAAMLWDDNEKTVHLRHDEFSWQGLLDAKVNIDLNCFSHRRRLWETLGGFDETLTKHSDYDLALRYAREYRPMRILAIAARYYAGREFPRLSLEEASEPNIAHIRGKHMQVLGRKTRVLIACYDYPQRSESYVDTEIGFFLRHGFEIRVCSQAFPGSPGAAQVPVSVGGMQRAIDEFAPDLIHAHWLSIGIEVAEIAERAGLPLTVRSHGFEFTPRILEKCAAQPAVKAIYLFPHFIKQPGRKHPKLRAVNAAFDTLRFAPGVQKNPKMVLRAAACLDTKDIELFFEAAVRCPEFKFVLALAKISVLPELPAHFIALNASLGNPVDIRFDVSYDEMAVLVAEAGIYLHTFGFKQAFGMPVSIAESMACGALVLARDCPEARQYTGAHALYYKTVGDAVALIRATLSWPAVEWDRRSSRAVAFANQNYADEVVFLPILKDWHELTRGVRIWGGLAVPKQMATRPRKSLIKALARETE